MEEIVGVGYSIIHYLFKHLFSCICCNELSEIFFCELDLEK